eukprot:8701146-Alexandrium_andersonii.AAC.1
MAAVVYPVFRAFAVFAANPPLVLGGAPGLDGTTGEDMEASSSSSPASAATRGRSAPRRSTSRSRRLIATWRARRPGR